MTRTPIFEYVCGMPPGDGPWELKQVNGRLFAVASGSPPYTLSITVDVATGKTKTEWIKVLPEK